MTSFGRQFSLASVALVSITALCAQTQPSSLPSAPTPQVYTQPAPPPPPQQATNPDRKPEPAVFQDLTPRKPAPVTTISQTAGPGTGQSDTKKAPERNKDPISAPGEEKGPASQKQAAPASSDQKSNDATQTAQDEYKFTTEAKEVDVVFTVTDKHGRFVRNLKQVDFKVLDNKRPPDHVVSFSAQTDLPLRVGLLIDASGSIRERFRFEQETAAEFMSSIIRPNRDKAFILGFDTNPEITQDFTSDTALLAKGVRMLRPGGGTALYDAVYEACRHKLWHTADKEPVRKAIIVVSDGDDNQSRVTREEAIEMAQRAEVIIYAISTNNSGTFGKGDDVLGQLASATGGRAFYPFKIEDLSNAFSDVQEELRSQYAIAYVPADFTRDGSFHTIEIQVAEKKYKARARRGYFAQKITASAPATSGR